MAEHEISSKSREIQDLQWRCDSDNDDVHQITEWKLSFLRRKKNEIFFQLIIFAMGGWEHERKLVIKWRRRDREREFLGEEEEVVEEEEEKEEEERKMSKGRRGEEEDKDAEGTKGEKRTRERILEILGVG